MKYVGEELDLFRHAQNWKRYFAGELRPYVRGRVLDAGCGMGVNAEHLWNDAVTTYTFLEPDAHLLERLSEHVHLPYLQQAERVNGTTAQLSGRTFDTILYLDVIEHIEDARAELNRAAELLAPGGHLLVLVPAFNYLYSDFDKAIGHYRRYDKRMLNAELPAGMERLRMRYLDSTGLLLSLANKWFLHQPAPKLSQVLFWDKRLVPVARVTDKLLFHTIGRSLISVSRKPTT
jgi:2-polyprenyl-3-methyl-5-hydroxy-6-metoxy-1,4-benzoquinol methylase